MRGTKGCSGIEKDCRLLMLATCRSGRAAGAQHQCGGGALSAGGGAHGGHSGRAHEGGPAAARWVGSCVNRRGWQGPGRL